MNAITFNSKEKQLQGRVQAIWKLWFQKVKLSNLHKIGRKSRKRSTKSGKIGIGDASA